MRNVLVILLLCLVSLFLPILPIPSFILALWPALCALSVIIVSKQAALGLGTGVMAGALLLHPKQQLEALRSVLADHIFPSLDGTWHVGAIVFTLILGSFAGLLEKSGGFDVILSRLISNGKNPQRRFLGGVYGLGLLCFLMVLPTAC
jgi:tetracycline resistance efflux pump